MSSAMTARTDPGAALGSTPGGRAVLGVVVERPVAFGADLRRDLVPSCRVANTIATETNHQASSLRTNRYRVRRGRCGGYCPVLDAGP